MKKFLIMGTQRTGSSAVAELVHQHPEITCGWEPIHKAAYHRKFTLADQILSGDYSALPKREKDHLCGKTASANGFRLLFNASDKWLFHPRFSPALWVLRLEGFLRWIATHEISIIHLVREDNVAWVRSKYMSKATGLYAKEKYPEIQITIPSFLAARRIKSKQWVDRRLSTLQNTNPYLRVTYEEFSRDNQSSLDRIFAFLGFDPIEITKGREKQSGREVVVNSEELRQLVRR